MNPVLIGFVLFIALVIFLWRQAIKFGHWNDARMAANHYKQGGHEGVVRRHRKLTTPDEKRAARRVDDHYAPKLKRASKIKNPLRRNDALEALHINIDREKGLIPNLLNTKRFDEKTGKVKRGIRRDY